MKRIMFPKSLGHTKMVLARNLTCFRIPITKPILLQWDKYKQKQEDSFIREENMDTKTDFVLKKVAIQEGDIAVVLQSYQEIYEENKQESFKHRFEKTDGWNDNRRTNSDLMIHLVRVNSAKVVNLQDITVKEILASGITKTLDGRYMFKYLHPTHKRTYVFYFHSPMVAYGTMMNLLRGCDIWKENPQVVAYEFTLKK